jgi:hypothetical protein
MSGAHPSKRPHWRTVTAIGVANRRWQGGGQGGGSGVHAPRLTEQQKPTERDKTEASASALLTRRQYRVGGLYDYLQALAVRLRRVRVCCGDWKRVLTPSVTTYVGLCGVLLDPPYSHDMRERCYSEDHDISAEVREWAIANGDNPEFRIALCGYDGEHVMPDTWECVAWKAHGGYAGRSAGKRTGSRSGSGSARTVTPDPAIPAAALVQRLEEADRRLDDALSKFGGFEWNDCASEDSACDVMENIRAASRILRSDAY